MNIRNKLQQFLMKSVACLSSNFSILSFDLKQFMRFALLISYQIIHQWQQLLYLYP